MIYQQHAHTTYFKDTPTWVFPTIPHGQQHTTLILGCPIATEPMVNFARNHAGGLCFYHRTTKVIINLDAWVANPVLAVLTRWKMAHEYVFAPTSRDPIKRDMWVFDLLNRVERVVLLGESALINHALSYALLMEIQVYHKTEDELKLSGDLREKCRDLRPRVVQ